MHIEVLLGNACLLYAFAGKISRESPAETNDRAEKGAAYVSNISVDVPLMETN